MTARARGTDETHVSKTLLGDRAAFEPLVNRYLPLVRAIALSETGNRTDANDIAQEAFLRAYRSLGALRERGKFSAWIAAITRNLCVKFRQQRGREAGPVDADRIPATSEDPAARDARDLLWREVAALEAPQRDALVLHYFGGLTARQVALVEGISGDAASKRIQRGRRALGERVAEVLRDDLRDGHEPVKRSVIAAIAGLPIPLAARAPRPAFTRTLPGRLVTGALGLCIVTGVALQLWSRAPGAHGTLEPEALGIVPDDAQSSTLSGGVTTAGAVAVPPLEPVASGPGAVLGEVTDLEGSPVPGSVVRLHYLRRQPSVMQDLTLPNMTTQTGKDGRFRFDGLDVGRFTQRLLIQAVKDGRGGSNVAAISVSGPCAWVPLVVEPCGPVAGSVADEAGRPVAGAVVHPRPAGQTLHPPFHLPSLQPALMTDDSGRFAATLPEGDWKLYVEAPGWALSDGVACVTGQRDLHLVLAERGRLAGRVLERTTGVPAAHVRVFALHASGSRMASSMGGHAPSTETDALGRFLFRGLAAGRYAVVTGELTRAAAPWDPVFVVDEGGRTWAGDVFTTAAQDFGEAGDAYARKGSPPARLAGRTLAPDGSPLPDVSVWAWACDEQGNGAWQLRGGGVPREAWSVTASDSEGYFELETPVVPARGTVRIRAARAGWVVAEHTMAPASTMAPLRLVLQPTAAVTGRLADAEGVPVPDAQVLVASQGYRTTVRTNAAGRFGLTGLPSGEYTFSARPPGHGAPVHERLALGPGRNDDALVLRMPPPTVVAVEGRTLLNGAPREGVSVGLFTGRHSGSQRTVSGQDGRFHFDLAPTAGPLHLNASYPDRPDVLIGNFYSDALRDDWQVVFDYFDDGAAIEGHVTMHGRPVPARVVAFVTDEHGTAIRPDEPGAYRRTRVDTDEYGFFRIEHLPAWPVRLEVQTYPHAADAAPGVPPGLRRTAVAHPLRGEALRFDLELSE